MTDAKVVKTTCVGNYTPKDFLETEYSFDWNDYHIIMRDGKIKGEKPGEEKEHERTVKELSNKIREIFIAANLVSQKPWSFSGLSVIEYHDGGGKGLSPYIK